MGPARPRVHDAPDGAADARRLATALAGADLVVVENICSLPINVHASSAASDALAGLRGAEVVDHHGVPWQRTVLASGRGLPHELPGALHVVVNDRSRGELAARGITAHTIRNTFDFDAPPGDRDTTRADLGVADDELVVLQPTRAIARKNVPGGVRFAEALAGFVPDRRVVYWLTGPAEDGYDRTLVRTMATTPLRVVHGRTARPADAYATADVVVFPSTWEGFGNPVIESVVARRPLAVHRYPVLDEILTGLRVFSVEDPAEVAAWLQAPDRALLDANREVAGRDLSLGDLPGRLDTRFAANGWISW